MLTDERISEIRELWHGVEKGYRKIKFDAAHSDMTDLLVEVNRLREENKVLSLKLESAELKAESAAKEMMHEIEAIVRKYSRDLTAA